MTEIELVRLAKALLELPDETEWLEFKESRVDPQEIGEYLSAISNAAALHGKDAGYILCGVREHSRDFVGTGFTPRRTKVGNEELENWLATQLNPRIDFRIYEFSFQDKPAVLLEVPAAIHTPVRFKSVEFIRVGTYKKPLKDFPEKERTLWAILSRTPFERELAARDVAEDDVLKLLDYPAYFDLTGQTLPDNRAGIIDRLEQERFLLRAAGSQFHVTNLGAVLFAKSVAEFATVTRKAVRVVVYRGASRVETLREQSAQRGYAAGFEGLIRFVNDQLPRNEVIGQALRREVRMYPEVAIRELVANALIHQDFRITGTGPLIEIFSDRIEITNPGKPLIDTLRFIDEPPRSRNETLAAFLRRVNVCEERGSGIDKVVFSIEMFQLPAPDFVVSENHTKAVLFAHKRLAEMDRNDRMRACYQHACLQYVSNQKLTNASLRRRFGISDANYPMASRIIGETVDAGLIKAYDPTSTSRKLASYVPFWA